MDDMGHPEIEVVCHLLFSCTFMVSENGIWKMLKLKNHKSDIQNPLGRVPLISETMAFGKPVFLLFLIILDYNESYKVIYY